MFECLLQERAPDSHARSEDLGEGQGAACATHTPPHTAAGDQEDGEPTDSDRLAPCLLLNEAGCQSVLLSAKLHWQFLLSLLIFLIFMQRLLISHSTVLWMFQLQTVLISK